MPRLRISTTLVERRNTLRRTQVIRLTASAKSTPPESPTPAPTTPASPTPAPTTPTTTTTPPAATTPAPPLGPRDYFLSDRRSMGGFWAPGTSNINGVSYAHSLHYRMYTSPASTSFDLERKCTTFDALGGIDDHSEPIKRNQLEVYADGQRVFASDPLSLGQSAPIHLDVTGVLRLQLRAIALDASGTGTGSNPTSVFADAKVNCLPLREP